MPSASLQTLLHPLSHFGIADFTPDPLDRQSNLQPSYWYEGDCPQTGARLKLPRSPLAETIAQGLMQQLAVDEQHTREGKMYGILLVETPTGELGVLKAFSGLLQGCSRVEGWVPPIPGRDRVALAEAETLAQLAALKQELIELQQLPVRQQYTALAEAFANQLQQLNQEHQQRKQTRQQQRQVFSNTLTGAELTTALEQLNHQSQRDGIERRRLKQKRDTLLQPLHQQIQAADARMQQLKQQRQARSRQLQTQLHAAYSLTNFAGETTTLDRLLPPMPTGTGDCCAPKLLHSAATQRLRPLAMAEFWWGRASAKGDKVQGEFYGACTERCQPLMGFLLSGLQSFPASRSASLPLSVLYEDNWLIAIDKPAGLLSVPGRYADRQDSVLSRLRCALPKGEKLMAVHRLDQDTSGILLLAKDLDTYRHLSQQFQQRQVHKVYEAVLAGRVIAQAGTIDLPLSADPLDRPKQKVDWQQGKPSLTQYQVLARTEDTTRVEFIPHTGRTHQLRVHAADAQGLGIPILGDRLYGLSNGDLSNSDRLHLHARELCVLHPQLKQELQLRANTPF